MSSDNAASVNKSGRFGTLSGVFIPSILTIFGVIMFMRANFVIGEAGILGAVAILCIAKMITLMTSFSVSAISTNMEIKGGGAYYIISRVLGPEFGGAIGVALFLAATLSVPFYIIGFSEAITLTFPSLRGDFLLISLITAAALGLITYVGANWAIKAQYVIGVILLVAILAFMIGAGMQFSRATFKENLKPPQFHTLVGQKANSDKVSNVREMYGQYEKQKAKNIEELKRQENPASAGNVSSDQILSDNEFLGWWAHLERYSFWMIFAIYFPAVTGILTGINMSGDLKNPEVSIPRGTLWAVGIGFLVYFLQIIICGGAFSQEALINTPYETLKNTALFNNLIVYHGAQSSYSLGQLLVAAGVIVATLSSAIGSLMGAPRVLQALAKDRIIAGIGKLGEGSGKDNEPRLAIILCFVLTALVLLWSGNGGGGASLNILASIVTMFFMFTYGTINVAAFIEHYGGNPSFRPRFRWFHWATALIGALGCAGAAMLIDADVAGFSFILLLLLLWHIKSRQLTANFGDARRGFIYDVVRSNLLRLDLMAEDSKNWRPTILCFTGNPLSRGKLIYYSSWLEGGKGYLFVANILSGESENYVMRRQSARKQIIEFCEDVEIPAFPVVLLSEEFDRGINTLLQTVSIGSVRPNILAFGYSKIIIEYLVNNPVQREYGMSTVLLHPGLAPVKGVDTTIDIWWRGHKNGNLMVLLAYMLTLNENWNNPSVRIIRVIGNDAGREQAHNALVDLIHSTRMKITPEVIVADKPFGDIFEQVSADSTCVFMGFAPDLITNVDESYNKTMDLLKRVKATVLLVDASGNEDMTA